MLLQPCQPPPPQTHKFLGQLAVSSGNGRHCLGHHWFPTHSVIIPSTIITRAPAPAGKGSQALCVKRPVPGLGKLLEQELHQGPKAGMVLPWDPMPSSALLQQSLERGTASWLGLSGRGCHCSAKIIQKALSGALASLLAAQLSLSICHTSTPPHPGPLPTHAPLSASLKSRAPVASLLRPPKVDSKS
jgi:hypothetical protein